MTEEQRQENEKREGMQIWGNEETMEIKTKGK